jgi:hypothetical protein
VLVGHERLAQPWHRLGERLARRKRVAPEAR